MKNWLVVVLGLAIGGGQFANAKTDLEYLPSDVSYNSGVVKPSDVLGSSVGTWHVRHDQLVQYMYELARTSDRVSIIETGRTHENRPLLLLTITAKDNQNKISQMQAQHIKTLETGKANADDPLVVWMGYSVHGDEASGSNASMLVAYYLAAADSAGVDKILQDNVILIDPALNPDGLGRFAQWANMHKGKNLVGDPAHREHVQDWPSGRTNHYWFDLNRDWLLLTHPESRARIAQFHQWRPHVLTDFHEMGSNSTYFFQPGIPSRKNPWTPDENVSLTEQLADFHAAALDEQKQLYFSQEAFDDFYYGKGSTYPDAHGSVGILFEQASSRGHLQHTINGDLSFADTIQNQVTTSLSTFKGALAKKDNLLAHQAGFKKANDQLVKEDDLSGYLIRMGTDQHRFAKLISILDQHKIVHKSLRKTFELNDQKYSPLNAIFVPTDQPQYRLIKSIFSTRKSFNDNTFYDVSNWNLGLAFNLHFAPVGKDRWRKISVSEQPFSFSKQYQAIVSESYAYAFSWHPYNAPKMLTALLKKGIQVKATSRPFAASTPDGQHSFEAGTVIIPAALNQPAKWQDTINQISKEHDIKVWSLTSGLTGQGVDLGSHRLQPINLPKVLLVGGRGVSQYEVGEAWHYFDQHVDLPVSIVELHRLPNLDLRGYTHVVMVNGNYGSIDEELKTKITQWVESGGTIIGQKSGTKWLAEAKLLNVEYMPAKEISSKFDSENLQFTDQDGYRAKQLVAGAAFESTLDLTHPLAYSYSQTSLPIFRNHNQVMLVPDKPFITAATYPKQPLLGGYAAQEMQDLIGEAAAIVAHSKGKGRVIGFADNVNFRGVWYGTSRLLSNAVFMAPFIDVRG